MKPETCASALKVGELSQDHANLSYDFQKLWNMWEAGRLDREAERQAERLAREVLRQEREAEKNKIVDWETRSRIAQGEFPLSGLNELWVPLVMNDYKLLKEKGFKYLPHILSVWAVKTRRSPALSFLDQLNEKEVDRLLRRAELLETKGLGDVVESVWSCISTTDRNTMIVMYLITRIHQRTSVGRLFITGDEGRRVIEGESRLTKEEKDVACAIIESAIDEKGNLLFDDI